MNTIESSRHDYRFDKDATIGGRREKLSFTVNSDLVKQYSPGVHPGPQRRTELKAINDATGFPILLFIDDEKKSLNLLYRDPDYRAGRPEWKLAEISDRLLSEHFSGANAQIARYDIGQDAHGRFKLFVEVFDPGTRKSSLFAGAALSNRIDADWLDQVRQFQSRGRALDGEPVGLVVGNSNLLDNERYGPLEVLTLRQDGQLKPYYWVPEGLDPERPGEAYWREFRLPTNATKLVAMVRGRNIDGWGVYTLTEQSSRQTLSFICLVDVDGELVNDFVGLTLPEGESTSLASALADGEDHHTDLYLGGRGLWCYKAEQVRLGEQASPRPIRLTRPEELEDVRALYAEADGDGVTLLALDGKGDLSRLVRPLAIGELRAVCDGDSSNYLSPVPIHSGLQQISLVRGHTSSGETLLLTDQHNKLLRFEHGDSGWSTKNIPIPAKVGVNELDCYTILVSVERPGERPLISERDDRWVPARFELSCEETAELLVNGRHVRVGPDKRETVHPDLQGKITIVSQIDSPAAPHVKLRCPYFTEELTLNPARKLEKKLHSYKKAEDMTKDLVDSEGNSLIRRPHNVGAAFDATRQLQSVNNRFRSARGLPAEFEADGAATDTWGLSIVDGVATFYRGEEGVDAMCGGEDWFGRALKAVASDVLRWVGDRLHDAAEIIVRAGQFAIKIGEELFRFVIDSATKVFEAFKVLLKNVLGLDLDAIFKWIGFLFEWKDVITTYKVFSNVAYQSFDYASAKLAQLKPILLENLNELERLIDHALSQVDANEQLKTLNLMDDSQNGRQHETDETRAVSAKARKTAMGYFAAHQMQNSGMLAVDPKSGEVSAPALAVEPQRLRQLLLESLPPETRQALEGHEQRILKWFEGLWTSIKNLCQTIARLVTGQSVTVKEVLDQIKDFVTLVITAVRGALDLGFQVVQGAVEAFKKILFDEVQIPFLTGLFRRIVELGGGGEPRFGLNAVNAVLLLTSVPATFAFKALNGRAPFSENGRSYVGGLDKMEHTKLFAAFQSGGLQRRTYTDYRHLSQMMSTSLTVVEDGAAAGAAVASTAVPAILNLPLDMSRIGCSIPIGKLGLAKLGGWLANWVSLAANVFGVISPGPSGKVTTVLKIIAYVVFKGGVPLIGFFVSLANIASGDFREPRRRGEHLVNNLWSLFDSFVSGVGKILINVAALDPEAESKATVLGAGTVTAAVASALELGRAGVSTATDLTPLDALT